MVYRSRDRQRRGTILPLLAVCMIGLFAFCGLAIDLGLIAVTRTQAQNAADTSALTTCRLLNGKVGSVNSNLAPAVAEGKVRVTTNSVLNKNFTASQISKIEAGQYLYNASSETFAVYNGQGSTSAHLGWTDVTTNQSASPVTGQWTAIRTTLAVSQPTFFMRALGVNGMPTGAKATAVFKPRDVAFVLDMTGSMAYSSQFNFQGTSRNPDTMVPAFAHYPSTYSNLVATANAYDSGASNQVMSMSNHTIHTSGGPPIVRGFWFDTSNVLKKNASGATTSKPSDSAYPVNPDKIVNAFHRLTKEQETLGDSTATPPTGSTYDFSGYDAFSDGTESPPKGPTPAPPNFGSMTDSPIKYVGDRYRRADGKIDKTKTSWATNDSTAKAASTVIELLGYGYSSSSGNILKKPSGDSIVSVNQFRDFNWEKYGYDMDIKKYRDDRNNDLPLTKSYVPTILADEDKFKGYSMGPGYWGKTFFFWPPDPRTPDKEPGETGYVAGDWRQRYFNRGSSTTTQLNPQSDNNTGTSGTQNVNEVLLRTGSGLTLNGSTGNYVPNYAKILKWIKSGPQVMPPNLRAGRVLYYSSIPDDVDTSTDAITTEKGKDKVFWRRYIDYVLGYGRSSSSSNTELFGNSDSWSGAAVSVSGSDMVQWTGPRPTTDPWPNDRPYMNYTDSPLRPRLHFWFGPLSLMDFLGNGTVTSGNSPLNWMSGTVNEAQCWQLKAGMNSVLEDVKNNHPNNFVGMVMFANDDYNDIRRPMGQNFKSLKNALFYPKPLLDDIDGGDTTSEIRPYNVTSSTTTSNISGDIIPNASGSTDPITGFAYGFNLLSPSASLPDQYTTKARRGAAKMVIFETDGVPNAGRKFTLTQAGYNSFYPTSTETESYSQTKTIAIVKQMVKLMDTDTSGDSGMSLPNALCRVYPIGFGDLFDTVKAPTATTARNNAKAFLNAVAADGKTGSVPDSQIITGEYEDRIKGMKSCMENIFQSGVGVVLVE